MEKEKLIEAVEKMSVLELSELVKALEEKFGVSAAMPMAFAAAPVGDGEGGAAKEEQTSFTVELKATGDQKINVIKALREVTTLGLKEAKDLADAAPKVVKEGVTKEEAAEIKKKLEAAGAQVEIK
ncbi:MAG: 50S ribosomal protein L7/L12 [Candidatus Liptonbacteria bacterium]|nr:50S ribosomal protein L7/L12 [Candidatus Liptonbacteria bacterium]